MRVALRFELPSGPVICEVSSDTDVLISQIKNAYRRIAIRREEYADADIVIEVLSDGPGFTVQAPAMRCTLTPKGRSLQVHYQEQGPRLRRRAASDAIPYQTSYLLDYDGKDNVPCADPTISHVNGLMEMIVLGELCTFDPRLGCFHAAAGAREGSCALLVGASGAGKTTTSIALCSQDWRVIADDTSFVDLETACIRPMARRPAIRANRVGFSLLPYLDSHDLEIAEPCVRQEYLAPALWYPITDVVFLGGRAESPRLARSGAVTGLMRLSQASFMPLRNVFERLNALAHCFRRVRWWECTPGDPFATAKMLDQTLTNGEEPR